MKHGSSIFLENGPEGRAPQWSPDQEELFEMWRTGRTGMPLVDANMRELNATGGLAVHPAPPPPASCPYGD